MLLDCWLCVFVFLLHIGSHLAFEQFWSIQSQIGQLKGEPVSFEAFLD